MIEIPKELREKMRAGEYTYIQVIDKVDEGMVIGLYKDNHKEEKNWAAEILLTREDYEKLTVKTTLDTVNNLLRAMDNTTRNNP